MLVTIYLPQLRVCEAICHPGVELNSSPHYTHINVQHMHPFHLLVATSCAYHRHDNDDLPYVQIIPVWWSLSRLLKLRPALCLTQFCFTLHIQCHVQNPSTIRARGEPSNALRSPRVQRENPYYITASYMETSSHTCVWMKIYPFTYHEAHTPMYASLRAYAR